MAKRPPLTGRERRAWQIVGIVIAGAAFALMFRAIYVRLDSGAGLKTGDARCRATPGCEEAMTRVGFPGFFLMLIGILVFSRVEGRWILSRRRPPVDGTMRFTRRIFTNTVTRYRSTWAGPVAEGTTTARHETAGPLSPADADELRRMLENPQVKVFVEGAASENDAREAIASLFDDDADAEPPVDPAASSAGNLSRIAARASGLAGVALALGYAELVL